MFKEHKKVGSVIQVPSQKGSDSSKYSNIRSSILNSQEKIDRIQLQNLLITHLSYDQNTSNREKKYIMRTEEKAPKLKRPPIGQSKFSNIWNIFLKLQSIMAKAYNQEQLRLSQFQQFQSIFKLNKNQIKLINYPDFIVLQTLRFAIHNKQQIPSYLVKVVVQMTKTNLAKDWEIGYFKFLQPIKNQIISIGFQPPLDLYLQFVNTGLIQQSLQQLSQVFSKNQYFYNSFYNKIDFFPSFGRKMLVILNQLPHLLEIYNKLNAKEPIKYSFGQFNQYFNKIVQFLEYQSQDHVFQRYLPQVKCRYIKLKPNIDSSDIQYLFTTLKQINGLCTDDLITLYPTKQNKAPYFRQQKGIYWTQFKKIWGLCQQLLINKEFHLRSDQLEELSGLINFQKWCSQNLIKLSLMFVIFREQAFSSQFPKSLIKNILWTLNNRPDNKKRKQCCYILLLQYFRLLEYNTQNFIQLIKEQPQLDIILNQGRQLALDILLNQQEIKLAFQQNKCLRYVQILKNLISQTKSATIMKKSVELYKKLKRINKFQFQNLKFYQQNILKANQLIQCIQSEAKNSRIITIQCIDNIIKILQKNTQPIIIISCLSTLQFVVKHHKKGQPLSKEFEKIIFQLMTNLYVQDHLTQGCKNQIVKLTIQCIYLPYSCLFFDILTKFLFQVYVATPGNNSISINSSYGIYVIATNFKNKNQNQYIIKEFFDKLLGKMWKNYKADLQINDKKAINILCGIVAFAKNEVILPTELIQKLSLIPLKNEDIVEIFLLAVLFQTQNYKPQAISQKSILNICQMFKKNQVTQVLVIQILQKFLKKSKSLPDSVKNKIQELTKTEKCMNNSDLRLTNLLSTNIEACYLNKKINNDRLEQRA